VVTTGTNTWNAGLDVVLEGQVERITDPVALQQAADVYADKYGEPWTFTALEGGFDQGAGDRAGLSVQRISVDWAVDSRTDSQKSPSGATWFR
jgi:hypothetical protein